jgi:hypothetical protein
MCFARRGLQTVRKRQTIHGETGRKLREHRADTVAKRRGNREKKAKRKVISFLRVSEVLSEYARHSAGSDNFGVQQVTYETAGTGKEQFLFRDRSEVLNEWQ